MVAVRQSAVRQSAVRQSAIGDLARLAAPVSLAGEQRLPVLTALEPLFPSGGVRRGSVVAVEGAHSTSLALAVAAAASAEGSWCAAVGRPALGLVAAAELGVALERFPLVPAPSAGHGPGGWAWVVATLLDAFDLVLAWNSAARTVRPADARRLAGRARERGAVLVVVVVGSGAVAWPEAPDVRLAVTRSEWHGLEKGHGRLRGRLVEVEAGGRGASARRRRAELWLPSAEGGVVPAPARGVEASTEMSEVG